ncbi:MAG: ribosomal RNA small subunit methyltransferase A [Planctomycetes bacterium]|nr:ribosomal RNA small subunit methyltransferase A [Planctomycetota bacterium]
MTADRDPFRSYLERLAALGFRPSRRLGQNFLLEPALHAAVADAAELGRGDVALEVGGGLGFLTRALAGRAGAVVCAEIDARLVELLREELARLGPEACPVELVHTDVLGDGGLAAPILAALRPALARGLRFVVAANLPYAISGPFVATVLASGPLPPPERLALLVQREFADRLAAAPGGADYGSLSVLAQAFHDVRRVRRVPSEAFRPRPNVDSAIVALRARDPGDAGLPAGAERQRFARFVREAFAMRRKTLRHGLRRVEERLGVRVAAAAAELAARPEALAPGDWLSLWARAAPIADGG